MMCHDVTWSRLLCAYFERGEAPQYGKVAPRERKEDAAEELWWSRSVLSGRRFRPLGRTAGLTFAVAILVLGGQSEESFSHYLGGVVQKWVCCFTAFQRHLPPF
jgi:hypothetical protein